MNALLSIAREFLGLSVKEVAEQLQCTEFEVRKIEKDEDYNEELLQLYEKLLTDCFSAVG